MKMNVKRNAQQREMSKKIRTKFMANLSSFSSGTRVRRSSWKTA